MDRLKKYLNSRKMTDFNYLNSVISKTLDDKEFILFTVEGQDYMLSHFFDETNNLGYGLIISNQILKTESTNMIAIAAVQGDDLVCINSDDNSIWLWRIQSGNGEYLKISDCFKTFIIKSTKE